VSGIERTDRWIDDLLATLGAAEALVARGREAYDADTALPLTFEALSNRVGDLATRLTAVDPARFAEPIWAQAARNRDFVVHHDDRIDREALWQTATQGFPELRVAAARARGRTT